MPEARRARPVTEVGGEVLTRRGSGLAEFDRVLGGGIVPGASILLSGEPGVGKSTLLTAVAARVAAMGGTVLYVSAEESLGQVRLRAERTGSLHESLWLSAETDLAVILGQIEQVAPDLVIVDSVQTVSAAETPGFAGGPSQVREVAASLVRGAKDTGVPLLLVGHVTKDGQIAGPRVLEHLVDVVCHFDGDRHSALRFVRAVKNRFGPTDEVGCFEMTGDGIAEVPDPSGLFLSRAVELEPGTCVTMSLEGRRVLPVEIQALVTRTTAPQPRRVVNGVDPARLAMLIAVLERRCGLRFHDTDVYVSTVGGAKVSDPSADLAAAVTVASAAYDHSVRPRMVAIGEIGLADLAIALALASAALDAPIPNRVTAVGEIGLTGEVRPAPATARREAEAHRLGLTPLVGPDAATLRDGIRQAGLGAGVRPA